MRVITRLYGLLKHLRGQDGQDLVEYALVVALIAFAATASMKVLASDINRAFSNLGSAITTNIT